MPNMALLAISLAAFSIFLNEGAIADWSAVYLRETLKSDPYLVGMAYAGYAMFMAIGRFTGDMLIPKFGKKNLVIGGGLLSALSMSALLILHDPWAAIVGFSLVGLGFSCIVPILYSSAANEPGYTAESAIAVVSTISFIGFFIGMFIGIICYAILVHNWSGIGRNWSGIVPNAPKTLLGHTQTKSFIGKCHKQSHKKSTSYGTSGRSAKGKITVH